MAEIILDQVDKVYPGAARGIVHLPWRTSDVGAIRWSLSAESSQSPSRTIHGRTAESTQPWPVPIIRLSPSIGSPVSAAGQASLTCLKSLLGTDMDRLDRDQDVGPRGGTQVVDGDARCELAEHQAVVGHVEDGQVGDQLTRSDARG